MSDLLSIGSSGISAYQRALATISNNIANVSTDGYTRQDMSISSNQPRLLGNSYMGTGAYFNGVRRQYDAFVESNLRNSNSALQAQEPLLSYANRLIDIMGDDSIGLTSAMKQFFESGRDLATDPASVIQRSIFVRDAEGLAARFRQLDAQVELLENETRQAIQTDVGQINSITKQIAKINLQLNKHAQLTKQPSELLDQRDLLLRDLSGFVAIKTEFSPNGAVLVSVGDTINQGVLVNGTTSRMIGLTTEDGNFKFQIDPYGKPEAMPNVTQGSIGGVLTFRSQVLEQAQEALNTLAKVMTEEVNAVHRSGLDAEGRLGGDVFAISSSARTPAAGMVMVLQDATKVAAAGQFRVIDDPLNTGNAQARVRYEQTDFDGESALIGSLATAKAPEIAFETLDLSTVRPFASVGVIGLGSSNVDIAMTDAQPGHVLQVLTRDGRHLVGQTLTAQEKSLLLQTSQGMEVGATYSDEAINATGADTYMDMDIFFGARAGVQEVQQFDPVTFAVLAPALAPARLIGQEVPAGLTGPLAGDEYTINGVEMDALSTAGPLTADDLADWINNNSQPTGVVASVQDGALVLERPAGNTTDDIRVGLGSAGQPSDLAKLGLTPALHVRGAAADDLLVFVTNRSGASGEVALSAQYATMGGDVKQALRESPLAVRFTQNDAYEIVDVKTDTVLAERAFDPTNPNETIAYRGLMLSFSSAPRKGDLFTIDGNRDGIGNNEAMLSLVELEKKRVMPGSLTITEAYIERVSQVGNVARQAAISEQALTVVYEQAREARDGVSGVSLDQEAAELVRFQQAYQANAKVMQVASQLFDAILQVN